MDKMIVGTTFPKPFIKENENSKFFNGFPGILHALPNGDNVLYFEDYEDININDNQVQYYLVELIAEPNFDENFYNWLKGLNKNKVIIGGWQTEFSTDLDEFAHKVILGRCDNIFETIKQEGIYVKGITDYKQFPRYDLFDLNNIMKKNNAKNHPKRDYGINTSFGCINNCDFCIMSKANANRGIGEKPLPYFKQEAELMLKIYGKQKRAFMYDSNFLQSKQWKEYLKFLNEINFADEYSFFASANIINLNDIPFMKTMNVVNIHIGLEDIRGHYIKNSKIKEVCDVLHKHQILISLSYIVNPQDLVEINSEKKLYSDLVDVINLLKPHSFEPNLLFIKNGTILYKQKLKDHSFDMNKYMQINNTLDNINFYTNDMQRSTEILLNFDQFGKDHLYPRYDLNTNYNI
jgi:radical SAM superfamily enzyme YgiQ (UPF0313 family)